MKKIINKKDNTICIEGNIAGHNTKPFYGHIIINGTIIKKVSKGKYKKTPDYIYNKDCIIYPGMGDIHIHAREDDTAKQVYKEDYTTSADAAMNGGVTFVSAMPNTPNPLTDTKRLSWHRNRVEEINHPVSIFNYIGIDKNTKPIGKPGEYFYKCFFGKSVGDLTVKYASELDVILSKYVGQYISFHVEYEPIVEASVNAKTHTERRPRECINEGLRLLLPLIKKYKIHTKLCHWSTGGESFKLIEEYRKMGCDITLEVSPLHLLFDKTMTDKDRSLWLKIQMNPAVQSEMDRLELIKGLKNNFIQFLATDHAPHTTEEKYSAFAKYKNDDKYKNMTNVEIAENILNKDKELFLNTCCENGHSGAPWLDTYLFVVTILMNKYKFSSQDIVRVTSYNPGLFINKFIKNQYKKDYKKFGKGFGEIKKDYCASFTVINHKRKSKVLKENLKTKVGWSPLENMETVGDLEALFNLGKKIK